MTVILDSVPLRGQAYTFYVALISQADTDIFQVGPTLAVGDVQVSLDGAAFGNIAALPTVSPGASKQVEVVLSAAEMTPVIGGNVTVMFSDQAGDEWTDVMIAVRPTTSTMEALAVIVWAAAARTLTSFGNLANSIWSFASRTLTMSIANIRSAVTGNDLYLYRGDTWSQDITQLGDISTRTMLWFTVKDEKDDTDAQAQIAIEETAGLEAIAGSAALVAGNGSITVTDAALGNITIRLEAAEAAKLEPTSRWWYDIQWFDGTTVLTLRKARFMPETDVTRAVS